MKGSQIPKLSKTQKAPPLKCPRCSSTNTKFCYYNNYSITQPRYFCRTCRRHWTAGGSLRNIPFGSCRKNKRQKLTATAESDFLKITNSAVCENRDGFGVLLTKNFRPLEFEFGKLSCGFSLSENSTSLSRSNGYSFDGLEEGLMKDESKSTASVMDEESSVFSADLFDFWDDFGGF